MLNIKTNDPELYSYYEALLAHDWYYDSRTDPMKWQEGENNYQRLYKASYLSRKHQELWDSYKEYVLCGLNDGICPKPVVEYYG